MAISYYICVHELIFGPLRTELFYVEDFYSASRGEQVDPVLFGALLFIYFRRLRWDSQSNRIIFRARKIWIKVALGEECTWDWRWN